MRRRAILVGASLAFVTLGLACVDLFHSTDFETLCTATPSDPSCGSDAETGPSGDGPTADRNVDASVPPPAVDFCAWSTIEAATQAKRACAWLGACERPFDQSGFGSCVVRAELAFDCKANPSLRPSGATGEFWACLSAVKSCDDVDHCVFPDGVNTCEGVSGGGTSVVCGTGRNSGVRIDCVGALPTRATGVEPCVMLGQVCTTEGQGAASCTGTRGFACSNSGCSGTSATDCSPSSADHGVDCANSGAGKCTLVDGGGACTPGSGASCATDSAPSCAGAIVKSCVGGKDITVNCNLLGLTCNVTGVPGYDPTAACVTATPLCNLSDKCIGTRLQSCGRGLLFEVDCASVGLGTCQVGPPIGKAFCTAP